MVVVHEERQPSDCDGAGAVPARDSDVEGDTTGDSERAALATDPSVNCLDGGEDKSSHSYSGARMAGIGLFDHYDRKSFGAARRTSTGDR